MDWPFAAGVLLTVGGLAGYVAGVHAAYPGRAFSVTAAVVGGTLLAVSGRRRR